jgi:hypothetical protein
MRILPNRKMRLDGLHIEPAIPVDVSPASADLAIRNRWAIALPEAVAARDQPQYVKRKRKASEPDA